MYQAHSPPPSPQPPYNTRQVPITPSTPPLDPRAARSPPIQNNTLDQHRIPNTRDENAASQYIPYAPLLQKFEQQNTSTRSIPQHGSPGQYQISRQSPQLSNRSLDRLPQQPLQPQQPPYDRSASRTPTGMQSPPLNYKQPYQPAYEPEVYESSHGQDSNPSRSVSTPTPTKGNAPQRKSSLRTAGQQRWNNGTEEPLPPLPAEAGYRSQHGSDGSGIMSPPVRNVNPYPVGHSDQRNPSNSSLDRNEHPIPARSQSSKSRDDSPARSAPSRTTSMAQPPPRTASRSGSPQTLRDIDAPVPPVPVIPSSLGSANYSTVEPNVSSIKVVTPVARDTLYQPENISSAQNADVPPVPNSQNIPGVPARPRRSEQRLHDSMTIPQSPPLPGLNRHPSNASSIVSYSLRSDVDPQSPRPVAQTLASPQSGNGSTNRYPSLPANASHASVTSNFNPSHISAPPAPSVKSEQGDDPINPPPRQSSQTVANPMQVYPPIEAAQHFDPKMMHDLISQAVNDSRTYGVVSMSVCGDLRAELQVLRGRIEKLTEDYQREQRMLHSSQLLLKSLTSAKTYKPQKPTKEVIRTNEQIEDAIARTKQVATELWHANARMAEIQRRFLEHTAGSLNVGMRKLDDGNKRLMDRVRTNEKMMDEKRMREEYARMMDAKSREEKVMMEMEQVQTVELLVPLGEKGKKKKESEVKNEDENTVVVAEAEAAITDERKEKERSRERLAVRESEMDPGMSRLMSRNLEDSIKPSTDSYKDEDAEKDAEKINEIVEEVEVNVIEADDGKKSVKILVKDLTGLPPVGNESSVEMLLTRIDVLQNIIASLNSDVTKSTRALAVEKEENKALTEEMSLVSDLVQKLYEALGKDSKPRKAEVDSELDNEKEKDEKMKENSDYDGDDKVATKGPDSGVHSMLDLSVSPSPKPPVLTEAEAETTAIEAKEKKEEEEDDEEESVVDKLQNLYLELLEKNVRLSTMSMRQPIGGILDEPDLLKSNRMTMGSHLRNVLDQSMQELDALEDGEYIREETSTFKESDDEESKEGEKEEKEEEKKEENKEKEEKNEDEESDTIRAATMDLERLFPDPQPITLKSLSGDFGIKGIPSRPMSKRISSINRMSINTAEQTIEELNERFVEIQDKFENELQQQQDEFNARLYEEEVVRTKLEAEIQELQAENEKLQSLAQDLDSLVTAKQRTLDEKDNIIRDLGIDMKERDNVASALEKEIEEYRKALNETKRELNSTKEQLEMKKDELASNTRRFLDNRQQTTVSQFLGDYMNDEEGQDFESFQASKRAEEAAHTTQHQKDNHHDSYANATDEYNETDNGKHEWRETKDSFISSRGYGTSEAGEEEEEEEEVVLGYSDEEEPLTPTRPNPQPFVPNYAKNGMAYDPNNRI